MAAGSWNSGLHAWTEITVLAETLCSSHNTGFFACLFVSLFVDRFSLCNSGSVLELTL